jgi:tetratricopeptide (TPR) repeat protein
VAELGDQRQRLELLDSGEDPRAAVTAVFSWSVQQLPAAAAGLFRLLGLHPGPDISAAAAASLAGRPLAEVRSSLARLARAHLIVEHTPARFSFHDLLRAYASQLAHTLDTADRQRGAVRRIVDHYLRTAHAAARLLDPVRDPITLPAPQPGVVAEHLGDREQALTWMAGDLPVLRGVAQLAADAGLHRAAWQLAWALDDILERRGDWPDRAANARAGLAAARRLGDPAAQAHAHRLIALAYTRLDRHNDARAHLRDALTLSSQAGDVVGQAHIHLSLALALERVGDHADALRHAQRSLDLYRTGGHRIGQANALNEVGWLHALLGDHQPALDACRPALTLLEELGDRSGQAGTWDSLGYVHRQLGDHAAAITCYQRSIDLYRDLGERYNEADTLHSLGDVYEAAGHRQHARRAWQRALTILDDLGHPDAEQVRASLSRTDQIPILGR